MKALKKVSIFLLVIVIITNLSACKLLQTDKETINKTNEQEAEKGDEILEDQEEEVLSLNPVDYPRVDGSTATIPLSLATYIAITGASIEEAEAAIVHTRTANSYLRLMNNEVDLLIVYSAPESIEEEMKASGVNLNIKPIGKDALVFIANESNTVSNLTTDQIIDIYTGKITNWVEVGGEDLPIVAFQRPDDSGSQTLMKSLVMKEIEMVDAPTYQRPAEMGMLIDSIAQYNNEANALGYSVYYYAKNMYSQPGLKFLEVDGIEPTNLTIQSGEYPHVKDFYAVIRDDEDINSPAYKVFEWLTSKQGQKLVSDSGYVSVK